MKSRKQTAIITSASILAIVLSVSAANGEDCDILNGSFEDDGIIFDISISEPSGWGVDASPGKFSGYVYSDWATDGFYSLAVHSRRRVHYYAGDTAAVRQLVDLSNVKEILFDLKLETASGPWDPHVCSIAVLINDDIVWESSGAASDMRGEYLEQKYAVESRYRAQGLCTLSLGMRMKVDAYYWLDRMYTAHWDNIRCATFCYGEGLSAADINKDCRVDFNDLKLLGDSWLASDVDVNDACNLSHDGDSLTRYATINFLDFAVLGKIWDGNMMVLESLSEYWLCIVDPDYAYNLYAGDDVRPSGEINFYDFAVFAKSWLEDYSPDDYR